MTDGSFTIFVNTSLVLLQKEKGKRLFMAEVGSCCTGVGKDRDGGHLRLRHRPLQLVGSGPGL
jgi:hypothetical protein